MLEAALPKFYVFAGSGRCSRFGRVSYSPEKKSVLVLKLLTPCFGSRKSNHDVSSQVLDIQALFWQPTLQLLLTIRQINALKEIT